MGYLPRGVEAEGSIIDQGNKTVRSLKARKCKLFTLPTAGIKLEWIRGNGSKIGGRLSSQEQQKSKEGAPLHTHRGRDGRGLTKKRHEI